MRNQIVSVREIVWIHIVIDAYIWLLIGLIFFILWNEMIHGTLVAEGEFDIETKKILISYLQFIRNAVEWGETITADQVQNVPFGMCWRVYRLLRKTKLSRQEVKSLVREWLSICILKPPRINKLGQQADRWVKKAAKSFVKSGFGLGDNKQK